MRPSFKLGPWPKGIDQVSPVQALLANDKGQPIALRDAYNCDIDRRGRSSRRRGCGLVTAHAGLASLWSCPLGAYATAGTSLFQVSAAGGLAQIATLNSADPCDYAVLNDAVVVVNRTTLLEVRGAVAQPIGVADAAAPSVSVSASGGLLAGKYSVAVAFLRGSFEGGLSALRSVTLTAGQGIALAALPTAADATGLRVYRAAAGGETLYHAFDLPLGMPSALLGAGQLGKEAGTQWLRRMLPGGIVAPWRGRLLVARGRNLFASRPMQYGLYSPRHGFVQFAQRITLVAPVEAGVFVGTTAGVVFLRGDRPREWRQESTGALPPIEGTYAEINGGILDPQLQLGGQNHAIWLAGNGYVIGSNSGAIVEVQADRIAFAPPPRGQSVVHGRRVITSVAA